MDRINRMQYIMNMRPVLNKDALFSDGTPYYRNPMEPKAGEEVTIRFRTQRNNVDVVFLVTGDKKIRMELEKTEKGFDYYGAKIRMGETVLRYHFEVIFGWLTCYYNCQGVSMEKDAHWDFEIYPNWSTP